MFEDVVKCICFAFILLNHWIWFIDIGKTNCHREKIEILEIERDILKKKLLED